MLLGFCWSTSGWTSESGSSQISQNSFRSSANSEQVRGGKVLQVPSHSPLTSHTSTQQRGSRFHPQKCIQNAGIESSPIAKTRAAGPARPAFQSPASCPTLRPLPLLLMTAAQVGSDEPRLRGDGGIAPPVMVPELRVRLTAAPHGGGRRRGTAARRASSAGDAPDASPKTETQARVSAERGTSFDCCGQG